jgi:hypothetical protein
MVLRNRIFLRPGLLWLTLNLAPLFSVNHNFFFQLYIFLKMFLRTPSPLRCLRVPRYPLRTTDMGSSSSQNQVSTACHKGGFISSLLFMIVTEQWHSYKEQQPIGLDTSSTYCEIENYFFFVFHRWKSCFESRYKVKKFLYFRLHIMWYCDEFSVIVTLQYSESTRTHDPVTPGHFNPITITKICFF